MDRGYDQFCLAFVVFCFALLAATAVFGQEGPKIGEKYISAAMLCSAPEYVEVTLFNIEKGMDPMKSMEQTNKLAQAEVCFDEVIGYELVQRMGQNEFNVDGGMYAVYEIMPILIMSPQGNPVPVPNKPHHFLALKLPGGGA